MRNLFTIALFITALLAQTSFAAEPIAIGTRLEPLVDRYLIESLDNCRLLLHRPVPQEVAIVHDAAWEGNTCAYHTVFQDGELYRMYYRGGTFRAKQNPKHSPGCLLRGKQGWHSFL